MLPRIACLISLIALLAIPASAGARSTPQTYRFQQDFASCQHYTAPWCHTGEDGSAGKDLTAEEIYHVATTVHWGFVYKDDGPVDTWTPRPSAALSGLHWTGDCDDLAETTLAVFARLGVPHDHMARLVVAVEHKDKPDHMVALIQDNLGRIWVVGDTISPPRLVSALGYQPILMAVVSDGINWSLV